MTLSKAGLTTGSARLLHAYLVRLPIRVWFCTAQTIKNVTATNIPMVEGHSITRSWPRDGRTTRRSNPGMPSKSSRLQGVQRKPLGDCRCCDQGIVSPSRLLATSGSSSAGRRAESTGRTASNAMTSKSFSACCR